MLKVSTKTTYAIKALIDLAKGAQEKPERLSAVAQRQRIPLPFLEQIFAKLKKAGLVLSIRGPQGGYQLAKPPHEVALSDIVIALEGPLQPVLCSQPENRSAQCHEVEGCLSRLICNELDGELFKILKKNTLGLLAGEAIRLQTRKI